MSAGSLRPIAAASAIIALISVVSIPVTPAGALASWGGRVFQPDRTAPRAGVVVELVAHEAQGSNAGSPGRIRSKPTRADGAFTIEDAPTGTYTLHVETPEGLFVSSDPVELQAGSNTPMALALKSRPFDAKQEHGLGGEDTSRKMEIILAGVVSAVALGVYFLITEDESETTGSVF